MKKSEAILPFAMVVILSVLACSCFLFSAYSLYTKEVNVPVTFPVSVENRLLQSSENGEGSTSTASSSVSESSNGSQQSNFEKTDTEKEKSETENTVNSEPRENLEEQEKSPG